MRKKYDTAKKAYEKAAKDSVDLQNKFAKADNDINLTKVGNIGEGSFCHPQIHLF